MGKTTVVLRGEKYPFALDLEAFDEFKEITGENFFAAIKRFQQISVKGENGEESYSPENFDFKTLKVIAYVGLKSGAYHAGVDFDKDLRDVGHMLRFDDFESLMDAFATEIGGEENPNAVTPKPNRAQRRAKVKNSQ